MSAVAKTNAWMPQQADAIAARSRAVIVTAGAGSGKTGVLVECIVRSIVDDGIDPRRILAITFTNKAAAEMKNRVRIRLAEVLIERDGDAAQLPDHDPVVETIDAYCNRLLTAQALDLGLDPDFKLLARGSETARFEQRAMDQAVTGILDSDESAEFLELIGEIPKIREILKKSYSSMLTAGTHPPSLPDLDHAAIINGEEQAIKGLHAAAAKLKDSLDRAVDPDKEMGATDAGAYESAAASLDLKPGLLAHEFPKKVAHRTAATKTSEAREFNDSLKELELAVATRAMIGHYEMAARLLAAYGDAVERLKADDSVLTFADVELSAVELLSEEKESAAQSRFERVFVDEFQDVNPLQRDLIEMVSGGHYYAVGDAAQAIYGFRGADVRLIQSRREELEAEGDALQLTVNFRSVEGILEVNNRVHQAAGVAGMELLELGSQTPDPKDPVELLVADIDRAEEQEAKAAQLERAMIAMRIKEMIDTGDVTSASDIAILCRARSALPVIADALRSIGVAAVIEGGGGLWQRPEVDDLVALLAAVGNPNDEEQLLKVLHSPIAGISTDGLVLLARTARERRLPIWEVACAPEGLPLSSGDINALDHFVKWFDKQRLFAGKRSLAQAIEAVLVERSYDLYLLGLPEGERRFANVRALQRFAIDWEAENGRDPRAFADEAREFASVEVADDDQEAVVEQSGGDSGAVRLLTMHGAKGLQFDTVFLPWLGSQHRSDSERLRVSPDGKRALMTATVSGKRVPVFDPDLAMEGAEEQACERARLLYVAMTRAERRLVLSGAAKIKKEGGLVGDRGGASYLADIHEHLAPGLERALGDSDADLDWVESLGDKAKVSVRLDDGTSLERFNAIVEGRQSGAKPPVAKPQEGALDPVLLSVRPSAFSYSGLQTADACAYRWYLESVVGLSPAEEVVSAKGKGTLSARVRGAVMHALIEGQPFGGSGPDEAAVIAAAGLAQEEISKSQVPQVLAVTNAIIGSPTWAMLEGLADRKLGSVRREESFALLLDCGAHGAIPLRGIFDVYAVDDDGNVLVVDWKTSEWITAEPDVDGRVASEYGIQRDAYALAALLGTCGDQGRPAKVTVMHLYAERPDEPVSLDFTQDDVGRLRQRLVDRALGLLDGDLAASDKPWAGLCHGCPGRGTICKWEYEQTQGDRRPG